MMLVGDPWRETMRDAKLMHTALAILENEGVILNSVYRNGQSLKWGTSVIRLVCRYGIYIKHEGTRQALVDALIDPVNSPVWIAHLVGASYHLPKDGLKNAHNFDTEAKRLINEALTMWWGDSMRVINGCEPLDTPKTSKDLMSIGSVLAQMAGNAAPWLVIGAETIHTMNRTSGMELRTSGRFSTNMIYADHMWLYRWWYASTVRPEHERKFVDVLADGYWLAHPNNSKWLREIPFPECSEGSPLALWLDQWRDTIIERIDSRLNPLARERIQEARARHAGNGLDT